MSSLLFMIKTLCLLFFVVGFLGCFVFLQCGHLGQLFNKKTQGVSIPTNTLVTEHRCYCNKIIFTFTPQQLSSIPLFEMTHEVLTLKSLVSIPSSATVHQIVLKSLVSIPFSDTAHQIVLKALGRRSNTHVHSIIFITQQYCPHFMSGIFCFKVRKPCFEKKS